MMAIVGNARSTALPLPEPLLDAVKELGEEAGMSYQRYIRHLLENSVRRAKG